MWEDGFFLHATYPPNVETTSGFQLRYANTVTDKQTNKPDNRRHLTILHTTARKKYQVHRIIFPPDFAFWNAISFTENLDSCLSRQPCDCAYFSLRAGTRKRGEKNPLDETINQGSLCVHACMHAKRLCGHVKDLAVHIRIWWNWETLKTTQHGKKKSLL